MSDDTRDDAQEPAEVTRPRPRPRPAPAETPEPETVAAATPEVESPEDESPEVESPEVDEPEAAATDSEPVIVTTPVPMSAASRARRIGGRPVVPAAPVASVDVAKKRPSPPPPGVGRHLAAPSDAAAKPAKVKPPKAPKEPGQPLGSVEWIPAIVLGAVVVVLLAFIGIASHGVYWSKTGVPSSTRNTTQQAALAAAKTCIAAINTYDYRNIPSAEKAALACTTGKFTSDLKTVYEKTLATEAPPAKATQTAQVNQAGIRDVGSNGKQIDILIYGQLTLTNASTSANSPQYDPFGAVVTMDKVGSKWLVAKVAADVGGSVGS